MQVVIGCVISTITELIHHFLPLINNLSQADAGLAKEYQKYETSITLE